MHALHISDIFLDLPKERRYKTLQTVWYEHKMRL